MITPEQSTRLRNLLSLANVLGDRVLSGWSETAQLRMVQEECAELIVAISHYQRLRAGHLPVASEVADVLIVCMQAAQMVGWDAVLDALDAKLVRLEERLGEVPRTGDGDEP